MQHFLHTSTELAAFEGHHRAPYNKFQHAWACSNGGRGVGSRLCERCATGVLMIAASCLLLLWHAMILARACIMQNRDSAIGIAAVK